MGGCRARKMANSSYSDVPIVDPVTEGDRFLSSSYGTHRNLPGNDEPYWKVCAACGIGSFVLACFLFMGTSAGYAAAAFLMIGCIPIAAARKTRDGACARPMLIALLIVLTLTLFATMICAITESIRLHIATNDNIYKCHCDLKLSDSDCTNKAHAASHHVGHFNCFTPDDTLCMLCEGSGTSRVGVSCVFMWMAWLQQIIVYGYTWFTLCCYVSPTHPFAGTHSSPTVVMGQVVR